MKTKLWLATVPLTASFLFPAPAAQTNFFDGTFNQINWTVIQTDGFDGTVSAAQEASGGNPGYFMQINENDFTNWIYAFSYQQFGVYQPSNIPNAQIDFSIDDLAINDDRGVGVGVQPALRQNGTNYFCNLGWGNSTLSNWVRYCATNLQASNFDNFIAGNNGVGGPGHPDFSANGSAIQFGFATWNNNDGGYASRSAGFDNWTVVVHQAPLITDPIIVGGNQFQLQLQATPAHDYTLQSSTNLIVWQTILTANNVSTNLVTLVDPYPITNSIQRFYRVLDTSP